MAIKKNILFLASIALGLSACSGPSFNSIGSSSHFALPNSNVFPIGPVKVKTGGGVALFAYSPTQTGDNDRKVYNMALQKVPGATAIIDWQKSYRTRWIGYSIPWISWTTLEFEGTAVKAQTGLQELR